MKSLCYFLALVTLLSSCEGEEGTPGPAGPKGDPGTTGQQGLRGEQGPKGSANVMYSEWLQFNWNEDDSEFFKRLSVDEPGVTNEFFDKGGVLLVYLKLAEPPLTGVLSLPLQTGNDYFYFGAVIDTDKDLNQLRVIQQSVDGTTPVSILDQNYSFRYILIPGGEPLSSSKSAGNAWSELSYEEVIERLNISE